MDPIEDLRRQLGGEDPPSGVVRALSERELAALAAPLAAARARRSEELETGVPRALGSVPAPLRAPVRRILG